MAVRKSKRIGTIENNFLIMDSKHVGKGTQYFVKCQNCGYEAWKSRGFVIRDGKCPNCEKGRNYHNAYGYQNERLYERYKGIITRINTHKHYEKVSMCEEWLNDYTKFREWSLANGYSDELQIDRIDNEKGYSPDNCRWVTVQENQNNRRSNLIVEYNGESDTVANLARKYGKNKCLIYQRLRAGWSVKDAFEKEKRVWTN